MLSRSAAVAQSPVKHQIAGRIPWRTLATVSTQPVLEAARAGIGIIGAGEWAVVHDIEAGTLLPVLPRWGFDVEAGIYLVRPSASFMPARTEAVAEWIVGLFRNGPPWKMIVGRN